MSNESEQEEERGRACRGRSSTAKPHKTLQLVAVVLQHSCQSALSNSSSLVTLFASPNYLQGHTHTHTCMDTHTFFGTGSYSEVQAGLELEIHLLHLLR